MSMIEGVPSRVYDPLQSVLAVLPAGMYGTYEGLLHHMLLDPAVPMEIKEGLRYLSAVTIGCEFCQTYREVDPAGARLLPERFYEEAVNGRPHWDDLVPAPWAPVFEMANEVLADRGKISATTMKRLKEGLSDAQIVEALFYMLLVGASHRLSHALGIAAACSVPPMANADSPAPALAE
jgi:hypothetical protein